MLPPATTVALFAKHWVTKVVVPMVVPPGGALRLKKLIPERLIRHIKYFKDINSAVIPDKNGHLPLN